MNVALSVRITSFVLQRVYSGKSDSPASQSVIKKLAANLPGQVKINILAFNVKIITVKTLNPPERPFIV